MRFHLQITGGLAAPLTHRRIVVDTSQLPADQATELESLAESALCEMPPAINPKLRDAMYYELTITRGDEQRTIVAADGGIPPALGRLLKRLRASSGSQDRPGA